MVLVGVKAAERGFDLRTFECIRCEHEEKVILETKAKGWLDANSNRQRSNRAQEQTDQ